MKSYGNLSGGETKIGLAKGVPHSIPWFETSFSQVAHGNRLRPIPFPFLTHNKRIRHTWMALERKGFQTFPSQPALSWRTPCHGRVRIKFSTCHESLMHRTRKATPKKEAEDQCDLSGPYILSTNNAISHELMPMDLQKNCVAVAVAFTSFTIRVAGS